MSPPEVAGYRLQRLLGRGSGGEVWLASEQASGEAVAVKCVRPGADLAARDRLRREAAVLAGIEHPHVLRLRAVVGCGSGDEFALVLDLATGGSLARLVARRGPLPAGEVVTVLLPLAEALAGVHARGVVHGDVTPGNVLFTGDGRPVLADLGVARLVAGGDPGCSAGTPGFRDPHPGWRAGPATDVHGLAATCFLALTGAAPYDRSGAACRPTATGQGPLLALLEDVLAAAPDQRPAAEELARLAYACSSPAPVRLEPGSVLAVDESRSDDAPLTVVSSRPRPAPATRSSAAPGARSHRRPVATRPPRTRFGPAIGRWQGRAQRPGRTGLGAVSRWRAATAVLLGAVAVATAAVTGIAWAGSGGGASPVRRLAATTQPSADRATGTVSQPTIDVPDRAERPRVEGGGSWKRVLAALDAERSAAFATGDVDRLAGVYTAGSPAGRRDRQQLLGMRGAGLRAEGMRLHIVRATVERRTARHVRLRVVDVLRRHRLVDRAGAVVERRPGRTAATWSVTLALEEGRWRIYHVTRL